MELALDKSDPKPADMQIDLLLVHVALVDDVLNSGRTYSGRLSNSWNSTRSSSVLQFSLTAATSVTR